MSCFCSHQTARLYEYLRACGTIDWSVWTLANRTPYAAGRNWVRDKTGAHQWVVAVKATTQSSIKAVVDVKLTGDRWRGTQRIDSFSLPGWFAQQPSQSWPWLPWRRPSHEPPLQASRRPAAGVFALFAASGGSTSEGASPGEI